MRLVSNIVTTLAALAVVATPLVASAETGPDGLPLVFSQRPLTLSEGTLAIDAELSYTGFASIETPVGSIDIDPIIQLRAGASYGINEDLEVGAVVLPLVLSPETDYGNPALYGVYRFQKGSFQIGAGLAAIIPVQDGSDFVLQAGLPMRLAINDASRIDFTPTFQFVFGDSTITNFALPIDFSVNFNRPFFLVAGLGINAPDLDFDLVTIPLSVGVGYTLGTGDTPLADIIAEFELPAFAGKDAAGDFQFSADVYQFGIAGRIYLGM